MPNEHTTLGALFTDIASAIREKSGSAGTIKADDFPDEIRAIPTGEEDAEQKDVNFYGLNAHRMYSYTLAEIAALTALPPLPTKDVNGVAMTYDWCMTLTEVKALTADDVPYNICVAAHPTDGATHIHVRITEKTKTRQIQLMQVGDATVEIDWGDGSTHWTGTSIINPTHTWSDAGEYDVRVWGGVRCRNTTHLFNASGASSGDNTAENETVFAVELGKDFGFTTSSLLTGYNFFPVRGIESLTISAVTDIPGYFLNHATNLRKITIPSSVGKIGYSAFSSACIEKIALPSRAKASENTPYGYGNHLAGTSIEEGDALTNPSGGSHIIPYGFFRNCKRLKKSTIQKRTTNIGAIAYSACEKLREIVIPENVGSIQTGAFSGNTCLEKIIFTRATPPNLLASTSLSLPTTCEIYVPRGSLSAYTSATNYPSADTYTYVEY